MYRIKWYDYDGYETWGKKLYASRELAQEAAEFALEANGADISYKIFKQKEQNGIQMVG